MSTLPDSMIDTRDFRNTLGRFASGVTVITAQLNGQTHGMTANAFTSVSLEPPMILVSVDNRAHMNRLLLVGRPFGVSILAGDQEVLSNHFAGRATEALEIAFVTRHGVSLLDGALAYIVARVVEAHVAGDHTLYIGHVEFLEWREGRPLLFFAGQYGQLEVEKLKRLEWPEDDLLFFSFGSF